MKIVTPPELVATDLGRTIAGLLLRLARYRSYRCESRFLVARLGAASSTKFAYIKFMCWS